MEGKRERSTARIACTPSQKARIDAIAEAEYTTHAGVLDRLLAEYEKGEPK